MNETSGTNKIRDVALGGDHTVVLSGNQHDWNGGASGNQTANLMFLMVAINMAPVKIKQPTCWNGGASENQTANLLEWR
jgi:hypothetical protein